MTKISALSTVTPTPADALFGNETGTTTKNQVINKTIGLAKDASRPLAPLGVKMPGDMTVAGGSNPSATAGEMTACWVPLWIPAPCDATIIEGRCRTLESGATLRLGIYTITSIGATTAVGDLVLDAGTISGTTTGIKQISISQALSRGLYALCAATSNHTTVRWQKFAGASSAFLGETSDGSLIATIGWLKTGVDYSGGLPSTITADTPFTGEQDGTHEVLVTLG